MIDPIKITEAILQEIDEFLGEHIVILEAVEDPGILKAVILAGGPGSGKSYATEKLFSIPKRTSFSPHGLKVINSDPAYEYFLKRDGYGTNLAAMDDATMAFVMSDEPDSPRTKAKKVMNAQFLRTLEERRGMILDGTGSNGSKIAKQKEALEAAGYDVQMVLINTPLETALARNRVRARSLPDEFVQKTWEEVQQNIAGFKQLFGNDFIEIDNSDGQKFAQKLQNIVTRVVREPVKNPIGREWIRRSGGRPVGPNKKHMNPTGKSTKVDSPKPPTSTSVQHRPVPDTIRNPDTGRIIKVKSALGYDPSTAVYKAAQRLMNR